MNNELITLFKLQDSLELYEKAITPRSCGGGDDFEYLALIGDQILDLTLLGIFSSLGMKNKGILSKQMDSLHNVRTLTVLGRSLDIHQVMQSTDVNHVISNNEVKEAVEALLGATYNSHGIQVCREVVEQLMEIMNSDNELLIDDQTDFSYDDNPKGRLLELFQRQGLPLPQFETIRVGGADHRALFQCTASGVYSNRKFTITSGLFPRKKDAERDAAQKVLSELGEELSSTIRPVPMAVEKKLVKSATQSLTQREIVFSKLGGSGSFASGEMRLSTGTGELLVEWARKKAKKNPFGMLVLLSARLDNVSGASWHASLETDELVLLNLELADQAYFEIGVGPSRTKARKDAGRKILESVRVFEWLEREYSGTTI